MINLCEEWQRENDSDRDWVIKQATRTLVKQGYPSVFKLLGYTNNPKVTIKDLTLDKATLSVGDTLEFQFRIVSNAAQQQSFVIDYAVHQIKANGTTSPKVFKLKNLKLKGREASNLYKSHSFKAVTTRKYYSGEHALEILVNGQPITKKAFLLKAGFKQLKAYIAKSY